jgi:hypothetical protein
MNQKPPGEDEADRAAVCFFFLDTILGRVLAILPSASDGAKWVKQ